MQGISKAGEAPNYYPKSRLAGEVTSHLFKAIG